MNILGQFIEFCFHIQNKWKCPMAFNYNLKVANSQKVFSAQGRDLAVFVGNVTKVKIPSEMKPPLAISRFDN